VVTALRQVVRPYLVSERIITVESSTSQILRSLDDIDTSPQNLMPKTPCEPYNWLLLCSLLGQAESCLGLSPYLGLGSICKNPQICLSAFYLENRLCSVLVTDCMVTDANADVSYLSVYDLLDQIRPVFARSPSLHFGIIASAWSRSVQQAYDDIGMLDGSVDDGLNDVEPVYWSEIDVSKTTEHSSVVPAGRTGPPVKHLAILRHICRYLTNHMRLGWCEILSLMKQVCSSPLPCTDDPVNGTCTIAKDWTLYCLHSVVLLAIGDRLDQDGAGVSFSLNYQRSYYATLF
jgi:hypothetical protein